MPTPRRRRCGQVLPTEHRRGRACRVGANFEGNCPGGVSRGNRVIQLQIHRPSYICLMATHLLIFKVIRIEALELDSADGGDADVMLDHEVG